MNIDPDQLSKQTIRLGGGARQPRKHHSRGKQKGKKLVGVGSAGRQHSPLHEARSEDEDEDNCDGEMRGAVIIQGSSH